MTRPTIIGRAFPYLTQGTLGGDGDAPAGAPPSPSCCDPAAEAPDRALGDNGGSAWKLGATLGASANVLIGITLTEEGSIAITDSEKANDDSIATGSTYSAAGVYSGGEDAHWVADLGEAVLVTRSEMYMAENAPNYSVWSSDNGTDWTERVNDSTDWTIAPAAGTLYEATIDDITARYWRMSWIAPGGYGGGNFLAEWRLFGQTTEAGGWVTLVPQVIDGDDATYTTITGETELIRLDLGGSFSISQTRIRIETETSGARVFTIKGANSPDFSDEVTVATIPFTANSFPQDVTATWVPVGSYRYYQLDIDVAEDYRVYTWELREGTLATTHQHSLVNLTDISGIPNTGEVLAYSSNTQLWQPRSTVHQVTSNSSNTLTNPFINLASGTGIAFAASSNTLTISSTVTGGGGGEPLSYGSNASHVGEVSLVGIESAVARADHYHAGVAQVTASSSNTLQRGTVNLRPGDNISFGLTDSDSDGEFDTITIHGAAGGGGGSLTVADEGTPLATAATTLDFVGAGVVASGTGATKTITIAGGSGSGNVIAQTGDVEIPGLAGSADRVPASPDADDDEFDTTDTSDPMTGWTTVGTPAAHNINSTVKSHYYLQAEQSTSRTLSGIRKASPSTPFTMTAKCSAAIGEDQYVTHGLFIAEASPGKFDAVGLRTQNSGSTVRMPEVLTWTMTTPTGTAAIVTNTTNRRMGPIWFRIIVASSTDCTFQWSDNGILFQTVGTPSRNPGFTIGMVGIAAMTESAEGDPAYAAWDWIRFT